MLEDRSKKNSNTACDVHSSSDPIESSTCVLIYQLNESKRHALDLMCTYYLYTQKFFFKVFFLFMIDHCLYSIKKLDYTFQINDVPKAVTYFKVVDAILLLNSHYSKRCHKSHYIPNSRQSNTKTKERISCLDINKKWTIDTNVSKINSL